MTALLVAHLKVKSLDWVEEYSANVGPIAHRHGGHFLGVSDSPPNGIELVEGETLPVPDAMVVVSFPTREALDSFMADPEYAPHRKARVEGTDSNLWAFENNDDAPHFIGQ
ncbi:DUF1330 domain-containing protein [Streptomyces sp. A012304]|uniref:DUF1330 domain-containing protein n=1 Tax=Streptomyces sp. A012304 TaxID=375446 RepID=UPI00222FA433|nr:DUF1330 domain-containing protein [Streptomyces sp. A012304]GKQ40655.1 hypothetical protein ALMP_71780 [Streptomyces sp. A012304]